MQILHAIIGCFNQSVVASIHSHAQLYNVFLSYAKKYPELGMTMEEFKAFVVTECQVSTFLENVDQMIVYMHCCMHNPRKYRAIEQICGHVWQVLSI